jgi:hypothetical protein
VETVRTLTLDDELEARLLYNGDPAANTTLVIVPGMGVKPGESFKKANRSLRRASRMGFHLNILTFLYPGHRQEPLTDFQSDPEVLATVMEKVLSSGVPEDRIGFLAICYGAYVLCRYRESHEVGRFAVLIEPMFGYRGLRLPVRMAARVVFPGLHLIGKPWLWGRKSRVDAADFHRILCKPVQLSSLSVPFLAISNQRHELVFDRDHLREQLRGTDSRHEVIDGRQFSISSVSAYYRLFTEYLREWVGPPEGVGVV